MDFKIDMSKVVKIVIKKDDGSFIEYSIDNGTIVDATILQKEETIEEKVDKLKKNNTDVQRISNLIEFDKAGILDRMVKSGNESVFDEIKDTIVNEPIGQTVINEINEASDKINRDTFTEGVVDAAKIMKLEKKMDEVAKANRDKIAEKVFPKSEEAYQGNPAIDDIMKPTIDKLSNINDREKRINGLKKMISTINAKNRVK